MPLVTLRQVLDEAAKGSYAVGAFNVNNLEQIQGVLEAARETGYWCSINAGSSRPPAKRGLSWAMRLYII